MENDEIESLLVPTKCVRIKASQVRKLKKGDHIARKLSEKPFAYHHGIYVGQDAEGDYRVIDLNPFMSMDEAIFNAFGFVDGSISERSLDDFIGKELYVYIVTYKGDSDEKREEVVKTAKLFLSVENAPYSVVYCNCESMALYCWTGRYELAKNNHRFTFSKIFLKW